MAQSNTPSKTESPVNGSVKADASAEKAYAEASAKVEPAKIEPAKDVPAKGKLVDSLKADAAENASEKVLAKVQAPVAQQAASDKPAAVNAAPARKAPVKKAAVAKKTAAKKPAPKKVAIKKVAPKKKSLTKPAAKPVAKAPIAKPEHTVTQLKEKIMAAKTPDYTNVMTDTMTDAVKGMQERAQAAYEKSTAAMSDATEFAKGNVEAVVESGKLFAEGVQKIGQSYADEAKTAYESVTTDLKEMAAIKSPTELFQLQGKILRRNFDLLVANTSKSTDAAMKLANDAIAPLSSRVNIAAEKLTKVA